MNASDLLRWTLAATAAAGFVAAVWLIPDAGLRLAAALVSATTAGYAAGGLIPGLARQVEGNPEHERPRQYHQLRAATTRMLDSVRRMNAVAVAAEEGKLTVRDAFGELTKIETEMKQLVEEMRDVAAREGR
ncbi:MAG: hypothetical protein ACREKN_00035 [Longimicrobiaceae bacterium]